MIRIDTGGIFTRRGFDLFRTSVRDRAIKAVAMAFKEAGEKARDEIRKDAKSKFKVKKQAFIKSISYKIYDAKVGKMPMLHVYTKIPFMDIQETGGNVASKRGKNLAIPTINLGGRKRIGTKTFRKLLDDLSRIRTRAGTPVTFTKFVGGKKFMFVNTSAAAPMISSLAPFIALEKKKLGRKKRGAIQYVPIALLIPRVRLKKHLDLVGIGNRHLQSINTLIEQKFASLP